MDICLDAILDVRREDMPVGRLQLEIIDAKTKEVKEVRDLGENLLVNTFYTNLAYISAGVTTNRTITQMQFGTGSSTEQATDTILQLGISPIKSVAVDHPVVTSTRFTAYLLEAEANGFPISEAGLLTASDTVVARKTFSGITKTSDYIFGFKWTISPS